MSSISEFDYEKYDYENADYDYLSSMILNENSTEANPTTTIATTPTTMIQNDTGKRVTTKQDGDEFMYTVMAAVCGGVVLIVFVVFAAFVIKARRRRRQNLRTYHDRQQRAPTVSLEVLDREDGTRETINGVNHALYEQDFRLPITTFDNQSFEDHGDQTSLLKNQNNPTEGDVVCLSYNAVRFVQEGRTSQQSCTTSSEHQDKPEDTCTSTPAYENTKFSKKHSPDGKQPLQVNKQNSKGSQSKESEPVETVDTDHNYETAFSTPPIKEYENVDILPSNKSKTTKDKTEQKGTVMDKQDAHSAKTSIAEVHSESNAISNSVNNKNEKLKPKVKPKPTARANTAEIKAEQDPRRLKTDENHDYENSLAKVKRAKFQQAKLLQAVPPPCNVNPYVNVPENEHLNTTSDKSLERQSSEYEDSETVLSLQKCANSKSITASIKPADNTKSKISLLENKESELINHKPEVNCKTSEPKKTPKKFEPSKSNAGQIDSKPEYANISVQVKRQSKSSNSASLDYENEDTVKELKSTLKRLGKRGFSASSLETYKQDRNMKSSLTSSKCQKGAEASNASEDEYLTMDAVDDGLYLDMDAEQDDVYMPMDSPEGDVYMHMENQRLSKPIKRGNTEFPHVIGNTSRNYLTAPKPCGGASSRDYVNFLDQPKYVNFFRSRSSDNVYPYSQVKPKNLKF